MRRKSPKRQAQVSGRCVIQTHTMITPDMQLAWYHDEVGSSPRGPWRHRLGEVRTQRGQHLAGHLEVWDDVYRIVSCGLTEGELRTLKRGLAAFDWKEL